MKEPIFSNLIEKYLKGIATPSEQGLVEEYYKRLDKKGLTSLNSEQELALREMMLHNIRKSLLKPSTFTRVKLKRKMFVWASYVVAASIIFIISTGLYLYLNKPVSPQLAIQRPELKLSDVVSNDSKTILTLADGSQIALDDAQNGEIAIQAGFRIIKSNRGELIYINSGSGSQIQNSGSFNKIQTPNGSQYQVKLPDGSKVWLNAASSLKFPASFIGNERNVELTGEAYFEIYPDRLMPFKIKTGNQIVEVLGTHFNINAYSNEQVIKTTLLEGSVKVSELITHRTEYLKPGEETTINTSGKISLSSANTEQAISWKNGNFSFNDTELVNIMRQLERWYDVEVDYSEIPKTRYNAHMSRELVLSKVLEMLEITGKVKFSIEGKTIKVSNKK